MKGRKEKKMEEERKAGQTLMVKKESGKLGNEEENREKQREKEEEKIEAQQRKNSKMN